MTKIVMQQALDALKFLGYSDASEVVSALKAELNKPKQKPVAWLDPWTGKTSLQTMTHMAGTASHFTRKEPQMLKTGELLMLSTEQYSDQNHAGPFKILKDFDIHAIAKIVGALTVVKYPDWRTKNGPDDVIDYLKANQFIEEIPCHEFHLGSYGDIYVTPEKENV